MAVDTGRQDTRRGKPRILIVEDDPLLRDSLGERLVRHGFAVDTVSRGQEALDRTAAERFQVILLDVGLPDLDGREVCRKLRSEGIQTPVIMLTALDSDTDTIQGLDSGANDYVSKPFRVSVLLARIRAHLRQHERTEDAEFSIGGYRYRPGEKLAISPGGRRIRLTEKENLLLKCLLRAGPRPVSRKELLNEVWGYHPSVATHTLETHIYRLRRKLERDDSPRLLLTEDGGYVLQRSPPGT